MLKIKLARFFYVEASLQASREEAERIPPERWKRI
jgi:hypothetical protein